jgi:predicted esterase
MNSVTSHGHLQLLAIIVCTTALVLKPVKVTGSDLSNEIPTWTKLGMLNGASSTEQDCVRADRVWVSDRGTGYCIRYFKNAVKPADGLAILYFTGDFVGSDWDENGLPVRAKYIGPEGGAALFRSIGMLPRSFKNNLVMVLSRPGQLGSSGDHKEKYKYHESRVMNAAIDQIKERHKITEIVLTGLSGGALLVANILAKRSDVKCAVMASGAIALQNYAQDVGFSPVVWGLWQDPMLSVGKIAPSQTQYYVLAGEGDTIRPPVYQKMYADALEAQGFNVHYLLLRTRGDAHDLEKEALRVANACASGSSPEQVKRQLKLAKPQ